MAEDAILQHRMVNPPVGVGVNLKRLLLGFGFGTGFQRHPCWHLACCIAHVPGSIICGIIQFLFHRGFGAVCITRIHLFFLFCRSRD